MTVANASPNPTGRTPRGEVHHRAGWTPTTVTKPPSSDNPSAFQRESTRTNKRRTTPNKRTHLFSPLQSPRGPGSAKPRTHEGRTQPTAPASGQDAMCCATQRKVRLTRGPCSPDAVQCTYSVCVRPSMTRRSPWSNVIREGTSPLHATTHLELHRIA